MYELLMPGSVVSVHARINGNAAAPTCRLSLSLSLTKQNIHIMTNTCDHRPRGRAEPLPGHAAAAEKFRINLKKHGEITKFSCNGAICA